MNVYESIDHVVRTDLCTGCGTCVSICSKSAVFMELDTSKGSYLPRIIQEKCNNCKACLKVCPGHSVDFNQLNKYTFGKLPDNYLVGNYEGCYEGYSNDPEIRYRASSGGVITQLLIFALENGIIDGALVTKMNKSSPLEPVSYIARTKEEIIDSMGSKYCPVPLNKGLKDILEAPKDQKFAVVGLPCQIQGIKKMEQINKTLKNKIVFTIGIICSKCPNFLATEYMLKNFKIKTDNIEQISYRGNGYPGGLSISFKNGENKFYSYWDYYDTCFGQFFSPSRCRLCIDFTSEFSDFSCGDVFFDPEYKDPIGSSVIISRNSFSENLLKIAHSQITVKPIEISKFINGCNKNISFRKSDIIRRGRILGKDIPDYNMENLLKLNFYNTAFLYVCRVGSYFAYHKNMWMFLKLYGKLIRSLSKFFENCLGIARKIY
jgi:coenzyme F420 hydrogenase subunit beta